MNVVSIHAMYEEYTIFHKTKFYTWCLHTTNGHMAHKTTGCACRLVACQVYVVPGTGASENVHIL
jgi:hypothetical protein